MNYYEIMEKARQYVFNDTVMLTKPAEVADLMRPLVHKLEQEVMFVLSVDATHRLISITETTKGLVNKTQIHAREIFRTAITQNAVGIILVHNHPSSGLAECSPQDIDSTSRLITAANIIGIPIIDHMIIGKKTKSHDKDWVSMKEENLIK